MSRYLVVANQTLTGRHLREEVARRIERDPAARFHLVVPATPPQEQLTWTEGEADAIASKRLRHTLADLGALGADVSGEVGSERPMEAVGDAIRRSAFDGIILSTLPAGPSRWLRQDLPSRVERAFDLPVTHLVAEPEPAP